MAARLIRKRRYVLGIIPVVKCALSSSAYVPQHNVLCPTLNIPPPSSCLWRRQCVCFGRWFSSNSKSIKSTNKAIKRMEKTGIGPDGKPLPQVNTKRMYPCVYKTLLVEPDGSSYYIRTNYPYNIITLPIDPESLTEEERLEKLRKKRMESAPVFVEDEEADHDDWDQDEYKELIR